MLTKMLLNPLYAYAQSLYQDRYFYTVVALSVLLTKLIFIGYNIETAFSFSIYSIVFGAIGSATFLALPVCYILYLIIYRPKYPISAPATLIINLLKKPNIIAVFFTQLFSINVMFSCYTSLKSTVGITFPFKYDRFLLTLDKSLHFGFQPWELTHTLFSSVYATSIINIIYNVWFFIVWFTLFYFMCQTPLIRRKFLIGFCLCWVVVGGIFAILLSSAGPCFIDQLNIAHPATLELLDRLNTQNTILINNGWPSLWSISTQNHLWDEHIASNVSLGSGISAMPSMHVSMAVYMALSMYSLHRKIGLVYCLFTISILIGSVHLGWHYAVDGYLSIILTLIIWYFLKYIDYKNIHT